MTHRVLGDCLPAPVQGPADRCPACGGTLVFGTNGFGQAVEWCGRCGERLVTVVRASGPIGRGQAYCTTCALQGIYLPLDWSGRGRLPRSCRKHGSHVRRSGV